MRFTFLLVSCTGHSHKGKILRSKIWVKSGDFNHNNPVTRYPPAPHQLSSKPGFFRQTSERRSFRLLDVRKTKDAGISSSYRISPPSTPSSPDDTPCLSGDPYNRRRRKIPKVKGTPRGSAFCETPRGLVEKGVCEVCLLI